MATAQRKMKTIILSNPTLTLRRKQARTGMQKVNRHDVWMPRLGTCIASEALTLTLRARSVLHSFGIPRFIFFPVHSKYGEEAHPQRTQR